MSKPSKKTKAQMDLARQARGQRVTTLETLTPFQIRTIRAIAADTADEVLFRQCLAALYSPGRTAARELARRDVMQVLTILEERGEM